MPLFNKFEPIDDEQFQKPSEKLLEKVDFKSKGLFVMDASLRSTHGNAFFTGFGKNKRIVFFDTLENPSTKAPPFNEDKYKASSSANLLAFSMLVS